MTPFSRIGPYSLVRRLSAERDIWLASTQACATPVVLKLARLGDAAAHARLLHEVAIAGQFDHPNIMRIHECGRAGDLLWVAEDYAASDDPLTLANFRQLLLALLHVHANDIVHADIRPANLLLDHGAILRLANFTFARKVGQAAAQDGARSAYGSPEQRRGDVIDVRADIYAAGAVLHEILTTRPYDSASPAPVSALAPGLGMSFDGVVARALAEEPAARYGQVFQMLVAFDAACQRGVPARHY